MNLSSSVGDATHSLLGRKPDQALVAPQFWPKWLDEIELALPVGAQFVLHGNVRDVQLIPTASGLVAVPTVQSLWERLQLRGYSFLLVFDRFDGLRVYPKEAAGIVEQALGGRLTWFRSVQLGQSEAPQSTAGEECATSRLPEIIRAISVSTARCGLVVENASRLILSPGQLSEADLQLFAACERLSRSASPRQPSPNSGQPLFNPVFWLANRIRDMPDWFVIGNERIRAISVPKPDFEIRRALVEQLAETISPGIALSETPGKKLVDSFAAQSEGLTLRSIIAVTQIARDQQIPLEQIADAIRCYKVGVPDDPWKKPHLREMIRRAEEEFRIWVKGQDAAIRKTLDILTRSVMGLSGAQTLSAVSRPRGVLFFAGPTGVGKTELAKAISRLIFGDSQACIRFDMSEFSAEHSDARLIGAPPGYVGYDSGGELVNAVRERPFSVLLFDEIEKAHPRILDKFLQILEDGRLTDGHGDTVYFSETVIIFTSNLGVFREDDQGKRAFNVSPESDYAEVKKRVTNSIEDYFRLHLQRPELLNRIGDNIVIFDFIRPLVAKEIFERNISNILARVKAVHGLTIIISPGVQQQLFELCASDLVNGGRGIGNQLETRFVNPLARSLFELNSPPGSEVTVSSIAFDLGKSVETLTCS